MQNNGMQMLTLKKNPPKIITEEWETIQEHIQNEFTGKTAATFVTMQHGICMGSYVQGEFIMPGRLPLEPHYLRSMRVFDADSECYVWRSSMDASGIFRMRVILDQEKNDTDEILHPIEARQMLWGTTLEKCPDDPDWYLLKEDRGIELLIHHSLLLPNVKVTTRNRLWLITHNYIDYNDLGQAGYVDCRFIKIQSEGEGEQND